MIEILVPFISFSLPCRKSCFENWVLNWKWPYLPSIINGSNKEGDCPAANPPFMAFCFGSNHVLQCTLISSPQHAATNLVVFQKLCTWDDEQVKLLWYNTFFCCCHLGVSRIRDATTFIETMPFSYPLPCAFLYASCIDLGYVEPWVKKLLTVKHYCAWNLKKISLVYVVAWEDNTVSLFIWLSLIGLWFLYCSCYGS